MELRFILRAISRLRTLVLALTVIAAVAGMAVGLGGGGYTSNATMLITAPSESRLQSNVAGDPDRYVVGQMATIESDDIRQQVAERLGARSDRVDLSQIQVTHDVATDIVRLRITTSDPVLSQDVVQAFVDAYLVSAQEELESGTDPEADRLGERIRGLGDDLAAIDQQIAALIQPYLPAPGSGVPVMAPGIDQLSPGLVTARDQKQFEYRLVVQQLNDLQASNRIRVTSRVIQTATLPASIAKSSPVNAGIVFGAVGFLVGALISVWSLSRRRDETSDEATSIPVEAAPVVEDRRPIVDEAVSNEPRVHTPTGTPAPRRPDGVVPGTVAHDRGDVARRSRRWRTSNRD